MRVGGWEGGREEGMREGEKEIHIYTIHTAHGHVLHMYMMTCTL